MADETNTPLPGTRERLIEAARAAIEKDKGPDHMVSTPGFDVIEYDGAIDLGVVVDTILDELRIPSETSAKAGLRALGEARSGLPGGLHPLHIAAAFTAMNDAIREGAG